MPEPSLLGSTYANTLPVNQQILPSILIKLNLFLRRYPNKLVIPIKLFPINLHFMGVLRLFHLNSVWDFCYPVCDFSSTFPINSGYRMHSREGLYLTEMLVFNVLPDISKCGCWMKKCLTGIWRTIASLISSHAWLSYHLHGLQAYFCQASSTFPCAHQISFPEISPATVCLERKITTYSVFFK